MMQAQADGIPSFWTEPWRWAAPEWYRQYGSAPHDCDRRAERLIFSGWIDCFHLPRQWYPPADPRWMSVVQASPDVFRGMASVLGYVALLRAGASVAPACRAPIDPWLAIALKFRDINCMRCNGTATRLCASASYACGVAVLRAMAQRDWPGIDKRLAMLVSPAPFDNGPDGHMEMQPMQDPIVAVESIDTGRCLSLCGAVMRHAATSSMLRDAR